MHLKKAFRCAVWALVIVFVLSSTALAAIPNNTIIFKDKAYDLSLLNDAGMVNEILNAFVANNNSFIYKTPAGSLIDPNAAAVNANQLPAVTYKDANKVSTQYSAGDGPVVPQEVAVTAVTAINDINVANGTALANIGLPATVEVTKADSTKANLAVTWDGGTPAYSATTAGTYTFSGTITLPAGVTNPNNLKASVKVIVAAPVLTVSSVSAINSTTIKLVLNMAITQADANAITVSYGSTPITVSSAVLSKTSVDNDTVTLTVAAMSAGATYSVKINNQLSTNVTFENAKITVAASDMPASASILRGSKGNKVYQIALTASNASDVLVTGLNLKKTTGTTIANDEINFTIANPDKSAETISDTDGFNDATNSKIVFNFAGFTGGGIKISAGQTKVVAVTADSKIANSVPEHKFGLFLESSSDITANANAGNGTTVMYAGVPVYGNDFTISADAIAAAATVQPDTMPASATVTNATGTYVPVYQFKVTANDAANLTLDSITLANVGTAGIGNAGADVNYKLQYYNTVAKAWQAVDSDGSGDFAAIALTNGKLLFANVAGLNAGMSVAAGTSVQYRVVAEFPKVAAVATGETVQLKLLAASDVVVKNGANALAASAMTVTMPMNGNVFTVANPLDNNGVKVTWKDTTSGSVLHKNATEATVGTFTVAVTGDIDASFNSIDLSFAGTFDADDVTGIKIYDAYGNQLSNTAIDRADAASTDTKITCDVTDTPIAAGTSKDFTVKAVFGADADADVNGHTIIAKVAAKGDVVTTGVTTVTGTYPAVGPTMTIQDKGSATLTTTSSDASSQSVGAEYEVMRFTISAADEAVQIAANAEFTFGVSGAADGKVAISKIYDSSDSTKTSILVGPVNVASNAITVVNQNAITIPKGQSKTYVVLAKNQTTAAPNDIYRFTIAQATSANVFVNAAGADTATGATGVTTGKAIVIGSTPYTFTTNPFTVKAATSLTAALATDTPAAFSFIAGADKLKATKVKLTAGATEGVKVTAVKVTATQTGGAVANTDFDFFYVLDANGSVIGSVYAPASLTPTVTLTTPLTVPAGQDAYIWLAVDTSTTIAAGDALTLGIAVAATDITAVGADGGAAITPGAAAPTGNAITAVAAALPTVSVDTSSPNGTITATATGAYTKLASFKMNSSELSTLTSLKVTNAANASDNSAYKLMVGGTQVGSVTLASSGAVTFINLSYQLQKNTNVIFDVYGSIANGETKQLKITTAAGDIKVGGVANLTLAADVVANVVTGN